MAGFQLTLYGRIWVTPKDLRSKPRIQGYTDHRDLDSPQFRNRLYTTYHHDGKS